MGALKPGEILATFRSDRELWEEFKALCDKNDISAAKALNRFLKASVDAGQFSEAITASDSDSTINIEELEARLLSQIDAILSQIDAKFEELGKQKQKVTASTVKRGRG